MWSEVGELRLICWSNLSDCVFYSSARVFIGRTPPVAALDRFLMLFLFLPWLSTVDDLLFFVIERLNLESKSFRFGLLALGESRACPAVIPKFGFRLF